MSYAGNVPPTEAFQLLSDDPATVLVDVRTPAEWSYVGLPDLTGLGKQVVTASWHPHLTGDELKQALTVAGIDPDDRLLFLCRSGQRSQSAATLATQAGFGQAYNVSEGFEGHLDAKGQRGHTSGWKFDGLPWRQS
ncbi:MAG: rhodanese-like domain-containing protein [bacterium]|nr:rhodanese-like domain-containing protein [bacterium]